MAYDNSNKGTLGPNDKQGIATRPDFRGQADIGGIAYWISGWSKVASKGPNAGGEFLSLSFERKDARPASNAQPRAKETPRSEPQAPKNEAKPANAANDDDDPLPF